MATAPDAGDIVWLQFNPQTLQFSGTAPETGAGGEEAAASRR